MKMKLTDAQVYGVVAGIGLLIGILITKEILGGVVMAILAVFIAGNVKNVGKTDQKVVKRAIAIDEFIHVSLLFAAAVIKSDGKIHPTELELVKKRLAKNFSYHRVNEYMDDLNTCLNRRVKVEAVCKSIKYKLDYPTKIQLMHFLVSLGTSNGKLVDAEYNLLRRISLGIGLPERSFLSILAMFSYQRIHYQESQEKAQQKPRSSGYRLRQAYRILEIAENATESEIKKAYRRLAKTHHPDRVIHLGEDFQRIAKEKFQKISDAYELIKQRQGIK